ncbi:MAG: IPT/TIG domain-containing protein [Thermomicrobia bacterium]|nr:IPT/TIG domain-containing protein [Thermomicrobia bacterium]
MRPIRAWIAALFVLALFIVPAVTVAAAAAPVIGGITPITGPTNGNTGVEITGTNLSTLPSNGAGITVTFGGAPAQVFCILTCDTQLVAFTPPHNAGAVDVTVTDASGAHPSSLTGGYRYVAHGGGNGPVGPPPTRGGGSHPTGGGPPPVAAPTHR